MRAVLISSLVLLLVAVAASMSGLPGPGLAQESGAEDAAPLILYPETGPFHPEDVEIDNNEAISAWYRSAHADDASEAFRHWDEDEAIRPACSVCHAGAGFRSFHGLDGSAPGIPEEPVAVGGVVDCDTCHNPGLGQITEITLPSGVVHPVTGVEAACMTCHQGRTAGVTVEERIAGMDIDTPNPELRFVNPHYATAAASWLGGYGGAGYHYEDRTYSGRFFHARPLASCNSCHDPHSLEIAEATCLTCHETSVPREIRISRQSYDGSGDLEAGIYSDIASNAALLMEMLEAYADEVADRPFVYDGGHYPYFFEDANRDGMADTADGRAVAYAGWTPRALRTAYNWKLVTADPGAFVHNPHYALELLYDSIADLSGPLGVEMDSLGLLR